MAKSKQSKLPANEANGRIVGFDPPALSLLAGARALIEARGGIVLGEAATQDAESLATAYDYAQIDPQLAEATSPTRRHEPEPPLGVGYAGLSPAWRRRLIDWLEEPAGKAPPVFQELYVAMLESSLLERAIELHATANPREISRFAIQLVAANSLQIQPTWRGRPALLLGRAQLLGRVLSGLTEFWVDWWLTPDTPLALRDLALGQQARLGIELTAEQLALLVQEWDISSAHVSPSLAALRLDDLRAAAGGDPLQAALARLGEEGNRPLPWRTAHRDLRFALPQPTLRPLLEPQLAEAFAMPNSYPAPAAAAAEPEPPAPTPDAQAPPAPASPVPASRSKAVALTDPNNSFGLAVNPAAAEPKTKGKQAAPKKEAAAEEYVLVVEFGYSRSEYYPFALEIAQRLPTYIAILDEKRELVHRVVLARKQLRTFWRLYEYIQNWGETRVYLNGEQLEPWRINPWSPDFAGTRGGWTYPSWR